MQFIVVLVVCALVVAFGAAMIARGLSLPEFSADQDAVQTAFMQWCSSDGKIDSAAGDRYVSMFTNHYWWIDLGTSLILTSATVAILAFALRLRSKLGADHWLMTPQRRSHFIALGVGVLGWGWMALMTSFRTDFERGYFPWCADSMGIPMFELSVLTLTVAPILVAIGWAITRLFHRLPVSLAEWDRDRPTRSGIISLAFAGVGLAMIGVLAMSSTDSSGRAAPAFVVGLYLLASTRSALVASPTAGADSVEPS